MPVNIKQFSVETDNIKTVIDGLVGSLSKKLVFDIHRRVTNKTPVDTGRARANWFPSIGAASRQVLLDNFKNVNAFSSFPRDIPKFQKLYITNNLPYISALNDGRSTQAPANFVELSVDEALSAIR